MLADVLRRHVAEDAPGAVVAVLHNGQWSCAARGLASLEHRRPITPDTVFDIASVSKQMTSAVAVALSHSGEFDLDSDTRGLVPELDVGVRITFRDCLQHLAGLPDYLTMCAARGDHLGDLSGDRGFTSVLQEVHRPSFVPRARVQYSNTGYVLTALAIHRATGQRLDQQMRRLIFEPLGMSRSRVRDVLGLVVRDMAFSYSSDGSGALVREEMPLVQFGDGAVQTTAEDLCRWHAFLRDGQVLGVEVRDELATPGRLTDGSPTRYGLGLMLGQHRGSPVMEHSGGMYGYRSHLVSIPEVEIGVSVLANTHTVPARSIAWTVIGQVLQEPGMVGSPPPADVLGTWFSPRDHQVIDLQVSPDGGLRYTDGYGTHDVLDTEPDAWCDQARYVSLRVRGDLVEREDRLGDRVDFIRLTGGAPVARPPSGRYECDLDRVAVLVRARGEDLEVRCGRAAPRRLRWRGRAGTDDVYASGDMTVVASPERGEGGFALTVEDLRLTCRPAQPS